MNNLTIEKVGTDEKATEGLEETLEMEVEEDRDSEGEEGSEDTRRALGDL